MPVTITAADFKSDTNLGLFYSRCTELKAVDTAFRNFEAAVGQARSFMERPLFEALVAWRQAQPEDYRLRNLKSKFLVDKLWTQMGTLPMGRLTNLRENAIEYTCTQRSTKTTRAQASARDLQKGILEFANDYGTPKDLAIILIDMESITGSCGTSAGRRFNNNTVLENQQRLLEIAAKRNVHVIEINIVSKHGGSEQGKTVPELKKIIDTCTSHHRVEKPGHPSFEKTDLEEHLAEKKFKVVIPMGYDANQCVKATIFGTVEHQAARRAALPGLLDFCTVVTSRTILSSSTDKLDPEYKLID